MGSVFGAGEAGRVQQGVVGFAAEVFGDCTAGGADGSGFRSGSKGARAGKCAVHALFSGADIAISISAGAVPGGGVLGVAASLLDLRQQAGGEEVERDAGAGAEQTVAGGAGDVERGEADGCRGAGGLFCAAEDVAGRAEQGE